MYGYYHIDLFAATFEGHFYIPNFNILCTSFIAKVVLHADKEKFANYQF